MSKRKSSQIDSKSDNAENKTKYDADYILGIGKICYNIIDYNNNIPQVLNDIYKNLGNNSLAIQNWEILSPEDISVYNMELNTRDLNTVHNFAISNLGMGWYLMAAIDLENGKVFIYKSGGSNGYDVEINLNKILNFRSTIDDSKYMSLDNFFELIITSTNQTTYDNYLIW